MEWIQTFAVIGANIAIIIPLWLHLESKMDEQARRFEDMAKEFRNDMRDFHGRLCSIEERNRKQ